MIYPVPEKDISSFLTKGFKKVLILEELDPIIENASRKIAQTHQIKIEIFGKKTFSGPAGLKFLKGRARAGPPEGDFFGPGRAAKREPRSHL